MISIDKPNCIPAILLLFILGIPAPAFGESVADNEYFRNQQRQQQLNEQLRQAPEVRLDAPAAKQDHQLETGEESCLVISNIQLAADTPRKFHFLPARLIQKTSFQPGMCLGVQNLQKLQTLAQNMVIERGFVTSQVSIEPQQMEAGVLVLTVTPGKVAKIRFEENDQRPQDAGRISAFPNKFPMQEGDVFNLRDAEQGLENLRRLPSTQSNIRIEPADQEGYSDIVVEWQQSHPFRLGFGLDDSGSKTTGKYQASLSLSLDNPLGLSDLLYLGINRDVGGRKASYTDADGVRTDSGTRGYNLHYSVPIGYWLLAINHNTYRYHEATEGFTLNYDYHGTSRNTDIALSRTLYRDARNKTIATGKLWSKSLHKYIDDYELEVQRRQTAGWALSLQHRARFGNAIVYGDIQYKRGTGMRNSLKAPEEFNDDHDVIPGTSRMKIISANLGWDVPFQMGNQLFSADGNIAAQWNKTPLTPQDKLAIGGRYTVRGFDGERSLVGERGWYWQNNLNWHYRPTHQLYLGLDAGRVSGESTQGEPDQKLIGAVLGLKGEHIWRGAWRYDLFAGKPLVKPQGFQTAGTSYGFSLNYDF